MIAKGQESLSESVYLDLVSADGLAGFVLRLARFPEAGVSWMWGHVFNGGRVYAFVDHDLPCSGVVTPLQETDIAYSIEGASRGLLARTDAQDAPRVCLGAAAFRADGVPIEIRAAFAPRSRPVHSLEGRTEVLGDTLAEITIDGRRAVMRGAGHFHEQVQREPRFIAPFTYATLRGDDIGVIFVRGPRGLARGSVLRDGGEELIARVALTAPGTARSVSIETQSGARLRGVLQATYRYELPIWENVRPGSLVVGHIEGRAVSGCMNDYLIAPGQYEAAP